MRFWRFLYRNGLWISVPVFLASGVLMFFSIRNLVGLKDRNLLLRLPLEERQEVVFSEAGRVVLGVEGPIFSRLHSGLSFDLTAAGGARLEGHARWFGSRSSGFSQGRVDLLNFDIPAPGRYVLQVRGLEEGRAPDGGHRVVFTRPHLLQAVGFIVGILLAAGLLVGSVVLFALRFPSRRPVPPDVQPRSRWPGTPWAVASVVGGFVAALLLAIRFQITRARSFEEFARAHGWSYSRRDVRGLGEKIGEVFPEERFSTENVVTVEEGERNLFLFDCTHGSRDQLRDKNFGLGCLVESASLRSIKSPVEVVIRSWIGEKLISGQADLGDSEFARQFMVLARDAASAREALNEELQKVLLAHLEAPDNVSVRFGLGPGRAVLLTGLYEGTQRWLYLVELARRIETARRRGVPAGSGGPVPDQGANRNGR